MCSVATTSSNLAHRQYHQYNSWLRITDDELYGFHLDYWKRLRKQSNRADGRTWRDAGKTHSDPPRTMVYPRRSDVVVSTLRAVRWAPLSNCSRARR